MEIIDKSNVSIFIMTYNEEINIRRCLNSVHWSNDVVILDSFSQDKTIEIARVYPNVRIFQRKFDDFSSQRNYGIHNIVYSNAWLLVLDADEVVEPVLADELLSIARHSPEHPYNVFLLRRKIFMNNRWLHWNMAYTFWIERLIRPREVHYEGSVHEKVYFNGPYGCLRGALEHHQFSKGISNWLYRRSQYANIEESILQVKKGTSIIVKNIFSTNTLCRRSAIKAIFNRLPARWFFYFIYNLIFKFPYFDGLDGLRYLFLETYSLYRTRRKHTEVKND